MKKGLAALLVQEEDVEYNRVRVNKRMLGPLQARDTAQVECCIPSYGL